MSVTHTQHQKRASRLRRIKLDLLRHADLVRQAGAARDEALHGSASRVDGHFEVIERERWQNMLAAWPDARAIRQSSCWAPHQGPRECARRLRQAAKIELGQSTGARANRWTQVFSNA